MEVAILGGTCEFQKKRWLKAWVKNQTEKSRPIIKVASEELSNNPFQKDFFSDERAFIIVASEKNKNFIKILKAQISQSKKDFFLVVFASKFNPKDWPEAEVLNLTELDFTGSIQLVKELLAEKKLACTQGLERFILDRFDNDLFLIENALWVLAENYADASTGRLTIEEKHILEVLPDFLGTHVFKIFSLLQKNNWLGAEVFAVQLLERGESELAILGMITKFLKDAIASARSSVQLHKFRQALNLCGELDLTFKGLPIGREFSIRQIFALIS